MTNPSLWDYACSLYAHGETANILLKLQDDSGININELLALIWASDSKLAVTAEDISRIKSETRSQKRLIKCIRSIRKSSKDGFLYSYIKNFELKQEKRHLYTLEQKLSALPLANATNNNYVDWYLEPFNCDTTTINRFKENVRIWRAELLK